MKIVNGIKDAIVNRTFVQFYLFSSYTHIASDHRSGLQKVNVLRGGGGLQQLNKDRWRHVDRTLKSVRLNLQACANFLKGNLSLDKKRVIWKLIWMQDCEGSLLSNSTTPQRMNRELFSKTKMETFGAKKL